MRRVAIVLVVAALVAFAGPAQAGRGSNATKALQAMLDELVSDGVPGAILLVRDGNRTVRLTGGSARLSPRVPMEPNDRFRVGHLVWRMESTVPAGPADAYGLGLLQTRLPCSVYWGHPGDVPGFLTFAFSSGSGARQVVLSLNSDALLPKATGDLGTLLTKAYCGGAARR